MSRSADWDCQGWDQQGSCTFVHWARASSLYRLCQLDGSPREAGSWGLKWKGQPGPADKGAAHLCFASWMAGAGQAEGKQPQSSLPFFGCFSNLQDSFLPRLIGQSAGFQKPEVSSGIGLPLSHRWHPPYSLMRPLFALV